jgi:D-sedoheptulose 7-phosphate isomerase
VHKSIALVSETEEAAAEKVRAALLEGVALRQELMAQSATIALAGGIIADALRAGGKLLICGNGGSAAEAQHIAAEFTGRFQQVRAGLPALALTADSAALTAIANDFGYEVVFSRQVEALGRKGDVLLAISTSGDSRNVLLAAQQARAQELTVIGLTGPTGGALAAEVGLNIACPGGAADRIQELHTAVGHILCALVESALFA